MTFKLYKCYSIWYKSPLAWKIDKNVEIQQGIHWKIVGSLELNNSLLLDHAVWLYAVHHRTWRICIHTHQIHATVQQPETIACVYNTNTYRTTNQTDRLCSYWTSDISHMKLFNGCRTLPRYIGGRISTLHIYGVDYILNKHENYIWLQTRLQSDTTHHGTILPNCT